MPHSQCYPVTMPEKPPVQPHLKKEEKDSQITFSGWCAFGTAGVAAFTILLCFAFLGDSLFPRYFYPYNGLVPIDKKGYLEMYPFSPGISTGISKMFSITFPIANLSQTVQSIQDILTRYPLDSAPRYRHCWLENPSSEHPCYFSSSWIREFCSRNSFGYEKYNGSYSPCFLIKIVNAEDWTPLAVAKEDLSSAQLQHYDPGFLPVNCKMYINGAAVSGGLEMYPPKGFSFLFFPISNFNSEYYLPPLVAVRVNSISKAQNITVDCSIIARNSLLLLDNGVITLHLSSTD